MAVFYFKYTGYTWNCSSAVFRFSVCQLDFKEVFGGTLGTKWVCPVKGRLLK